jgi:hypothetical protein
MDIIKCFLLLGGLGLLLAAQIWFLWKSEKELQRLFSSLAGTYRCSALESWFTLTPVTKGNREAMLFQWHNAAGSITGRLTYFRTDFQFTNTSRVFLTQVWVPGIGSGLTFRWSDVGDKELTTTMLLVNPDTGWKELWVKQNEEISHNV